LQSCNPPSPTRTIGWVALRGEEHEALSDDREKVWPRYCRGLQ
jgi:hypothetical protein